MSKYYEVQCDGMVGPSHHYGGLSHGNIASEYNAGDISHPKKAALQGLDKMGFVAALGLKQIIIPPQQRPHMKLLSSLGFKGDLESQLAQAFEQEPEILSACYSSAHMWAANMATITPSANSNNAALHITPANLQSTLHRSLEAKGHHETLKAIFGDISALHQPLISCQVMSDEGAANHMLFCDDYGHSGVEVFVYGKDDEGSAPSPKKFPARQTRKSAKAIIRKHELNDKNTVLIQQNSNVIDMGVFHNDVIAMSNQTLLIYHEHAFLQSEDKISELAEKLLPAKLNAICIKEDMLPVKDAVASYFFNSQLLTLPDKKMVIIAPSECEDNANAKAMMQMLKEGDNPITEIYYMNLRESMKNGGGPACLRLRVVMNDDDWQKILASFKYSEKIHTKLENFINANYPDELSFGMLKDVSFYNHIKKVTEDIGNIFVSKI